MRKRARRSTGALGGMRSGSQSAADMTMRGRLRWLQVLMLLAVIVGGVSWLTKSGRGIWLGIPIALVAAPLAWYHLVKYSAFRTPFNCLLAVASSAMAAYSVVIICFSVVAGEM
jgi:hypothetical protein